MYRDSYQRGLLTVFFSKGAKPFNIWDVKTKDGYVRSFLDQDIKSMVVELRGNNVSTTYMVCPKGKQVLGITMPMLIMIVKNLHKYFSFEVTILDDTLTRRRFRVSNFQSTTQVLPLCTVMPLSLSPGWNQIQFNLAEFTRKAYQKQFIEVQKLKINANIRLRRIYFTEKLMSEDELPADYKLFFPLPFKPRRPRGMQDEADKENVGPNVSKVPSITQGTGSKMLVLHERFSGDATREKPKTTDETTEGEAKAERGDDEEIEGKVEVVEKEEDKKETEEEQKEAEGEQIGTGEAEIKEKQEGRETEQADGEEPVLEKQSSEVKERGEELPANIPLDEMPEDEEAATA